MNTLEVETAPLEGVTLIEASAGTGKTHTITTLFLRLLLEAELPLSEILVVTYTRAATAELRLRIRARLAEALQALDESETTPRDRALAIMLERARRGAQVARYRTRLIDALRSFDESAIFTIHGFCQRVLRKHAFESGVPFEAELREDQRLLLEEIVSDYWATRLEHASESFVAALSGSKVTIETLVGLLKRTASNPSLRILPDRTPAPSEALARAFEAARAPISEHWLRHRREVEALLAQPSMNQVSYGPGKLRAVFDDVLPRASLLSPSDLPLDKIERLTPNGLRPKKGQPTPRHPFFDVCAVWHAAALALDQCMNEQVAAFQRELIEYARREIARRSEDAGTLSFDDLLLQLSAALDSAGGPRLIEQVRATHRAALIDEFQDTDPLQCEVFRRIYAAPLAGQPGGRLFLIGDPKQAIYAFRGADVFAYMNAARSSVDHAFTLATNYRSDPALLHGIDTLFARASAPFVFDDIVYRTVLAAPDARDRLVDGGAPFEFLFAPRQDEQKANRSTIDARLPRQIAAEIVRFLRSKPMIEGAPVEAKQIAVLCRTNAQAMQVQAALREVSLPAVLDGDASVFDSEMAEELGRLLWALADPADGSRVRAALATLAIGVSALELAALERDEAGWDGWVARFHALHELWEARGFMAAFHGLCDQLNIAARLLALPDGERRYTDLTHLAELLHAEAMQSRKGPHALLDWYRRLRVDASEAQRVGMAQQDVQIRLESDAYAITLTTIHKSKGLQYPIVYCPFMWAGGVHSNELAMPQFHDREDGDRLILVLSSPTELQRTAAKREALAEQLRLLYVAFTRAKHKLSVVWGALGHYDQSALAYLLHQPATDAEDLARATAERAKKLTDAELQRDLERLAAAAGGAIEVRNLIDEAAPIDPLPEDRSEIALTAREAAERPRDSVLVSSFSRLASGESEHARTSEGLDRDELAPSEAFDGLDAVASEAVALAEFPAGAAFGHLIHAIYEHADFEAADVQALYPCVDDALRDFGAAALVRQPLTAADWREPLAAAVFDSLQAPLSDDGLPSLARVSNARRSSELEFLFPVASAGAPLSAAALGRLLREYARNPEERAYAARLANLRFAPFRGFVRGFVDLVVEHDRRFYVLDYKSNQLGSSALDYRRERLGPVMRRHHYVLQSLVYSVALHRHLSLRLANYEYDRHFGGSYYLFIRGLSTRHPPGTGVFFDRPPRELIERLSALFAEPEAT